MFENYNDVVTVDDIRTMLDIGRNTAYRLVKENHIKSIRIGKKYRIPKASILEFLQSGQWMGALDNDIMSYRDEPVMTKEVAVL